jgi:hypothetical protein
MRKPVLIAAAAAAASLLTIAVNVAQVAAATATWTVTPGGSFASFSGSGHNQRFTDPGTGAEILCPDLQISGRFKSGTGLANPVGTITSVGSDFAAGQPYGCTVSGNAGTVDIMVTFSPVNIRAIRYDASQNLTYGALAGIHAAFSSPTCSGIIDGASAMAGNGLVRFKYQDNIGFLLTLFGGDSLHLFNVSGCGGLINSGDALTFRAGFALGTTKGDHATSITSP